MENKPITEADRLRMAQEFLDQLFTIQSGFLRNLYPSPDFDLEYEKNVALLKESLTITSLEPDASGQ